MNYSILFFLFFLKISKLVCLKDVNNPFILSLLQLVYPEDGIWSSFYIIQISEALLIFL